MFFGDFSRFLLNTDFRFWWFWRPVARIRAKFSEIHPTLASSISKLRGLRISDRYHCKGLSINFATHLIRMKTGTSRKSYARSNILLFRKIRKSICTTPIFVVGVWSSYFAVSKYSWVLRNYKIWASNSTWKYIFGDISTLVPDFFSWIKKPAQHRNDFDL